MALLWSERDLPFYSYVEFQRALLKTKTCKKSNGKRQMTCRKLRRFLLQGSPFLAHIMKTKTYYDSSRDRDGVLSMHLFWRCGNQALDCHLPKRERRENTIIVNVDSDSLQALYLLQTLKDTFIISTPWFQRQKKGCFFLSPNFAFSVARCLNSILFLTLTWNSLYLFEMKEHFLKIDESSVQKITQTPLSM